MTAFHAVLSADDVARFSSAACASRRLTALDFRCESWLARLRWRCCTHFTTLGCRDSRQAVPSGRGRCDRPLNAHREFGVCVCARALSVSVLLVVAPFSQPVRFRFRQCVDADGALRDTLCRYIGENAVLRHLHWFSGCCLVRAYRHNE